MQLFFFLTALLLNSKQAIRSGTTMVSDEKGEVLQDGGVGVTPCQSSPEHRKWN